MPSGTCASLAELPPHAASILEAARRGVLSTIGREGAPHSVPCVFVVESGEIVSPIDDKPKDGAELQRVRNLARDPRATLLVDRWDEDWTRIGWVMIRGRVRVEPSRYASDALRERYPQYTDHMTPGERALVLRPLWITWWTWEI